MISRIFFGLLGVAVAYGLWSQFSPQGEHSSELSNELSQSPGASREIMVDTESGEMINDPEKMKNIKKSNKKPVASDNGETVEKKKVKVTEMEGETLKVELGKKWIRSADVSVDEEGNLNEEGHSELQVEEAQ